MACSTFREAQVGLKLRSVQLEGLKQEIQLFFFGKRSKMYEKEEEVKERKKERIVERIRAVRAV